MVTMPQGFSVSLRPFEPTRHANKAVQPRRVGVNRWPLSTTGPARVVPVPAGREQLPARSQRPRPGACPPRVPRPRGRPGGHWGPALKSTAMLVWAALPRNGGLATLLEPLLYSGMRAHDFCARGNSTNDLPAASLTPPERVNGMTLIDLDPREARPRRAATATATPPSRRPSSCDRSTDVTPPTCSPARPRSRNRRRLTS